MDTTRSLSTFVLSLVLAACAWASGSACVRAQVRARADPPPIPKQAPARDAKVWDKYFERTPRTYGPSGVGVLREVQRAPLFDNLPFLRLKEGDKLLLGPAWSPSFKGAPGRYSERDSYFVLHEGRHFRLRAQEGNGVLNLDEVSDSVHLDWDVSLLSATLLKQKLGSAMLQLQPRALAGLREAVRKQFPKAWIADAAPQLREPRVEGEGAAKTAIFESLEFDPYENAIFHARLSIGNSRFVIERRPLLQGPPRVERREFEGEFVGSQQGFSPSRINAAVRIPPDPATAALRRKEYQRMREFQRLIEPFLPAPLDSWITGEPYVPTGPGR